MLKISQLILLEATLNKFTFFLYLLNLLFMRIKVCWGDILFICGSPWQFKTKSLIIVLYLRIFFPHYCFFSPSRDRGRRGGGQGGVEWFPERDSTDMGPLFKVISRMTPTPMQPAWNLGAHGSKGRMAINTSSQAETSQIISLGIWGWALIHDSKL